MASKASEMTEMTENREETCDCPLMDASSEATKKLIQRAKERGYITYEELNQFLPPDQMSSEQIEDSMAALSEMGITVIESNEHDDSVRSAEEKNISIQPTGNLGDKDIGRTDDPVRMYLREMGAVELLSREGEIAIAKRIEAGREKMIGGICESPLTIQAERQDPAARHYRSQCHLQIRSERERDGRGRGRAGRDRAEKRQQAGREGHG
jgi:RNA polymerase primary sigma factor